MQDFFHLRYLLNNQSFFYSDKSSFKFKTRKYIDGLKIVLRFNFHVSNVKS